MNNPANENPRELANAKVAAAAEAKRKRSQRPFPACPFEEALVFAKAILEYGSGQPVKRLSLFDHLQKSPDSSTSRQLITNSGKYGLTKGSYAAEQIELTSEGAKAADEELPRRELARARIQLAVEAIEPFKKLFDRFVSNKLPARAALIDAITEFDVSRDLAEEAVDTFIVNLRFVGLLQTLSGAERILPVSHYLDTLPASAQRSSLPPTVLLSTKAHSAVITSDHAQFETTCFYITPLLSHNFLIKKA